MRGTVRLVPDRLRPAEEEDRTAGIANRPPAGAAAQFEQCATLPKRNSRIEERILDKAAAQQISVSVEMAARYDLAFLRNDQLAAKPRTLDEIMVRLPNGQTELSRGRVKNAGPTFSQLADLAIKADIKGFAA